MIQRSRDGSSWDDWHQLPGRQHGYATHYYSAMDPAPYPGTSFYRLQQEMRRKFPLFFRSGHYVGNRLTRQYHRLSCSGHRSSHGQFPGDRKLPGRTVESLGQTRPPMADFIRGQCQLAVSGLACRSVFCSDNPRRRNGDQDGVDQIDSQKLSDRSSNKSNLRILS